MLAIMVCPFAVITLDCNGVLHGGKDTPLEMSMGMNFLKPMLDHLASKLKERLKCQCPSATATAIDDEFLRNFLESSIWTPDGRKPDITSECDTKADLLYMDELFSYIDIDLPNTCTYDKYKNEVNSSCSGNIPAVTCRLLRKYFLFYFAGLYDQA
jgi:hypothetical protein